MEHSRWTLMSDSGSLDMRALIEHGQSPLDIVKEAKVFVSQADRLKGLERTGRSVKRLPALKVDTPGKPPRAPDSTTSYRSAPPTIENDQRSPSNAWRNPPQTAPSRMGSGGTASIWGRLPRPRSSDPREIGGNTREVRSSNPTASSPSLAVPTQASPRARVTPNKTVNLEAAKWDSSPARGLACLVEESVESTHTPSRTHSKRAHKSGKPLKESRRKSKGMSDSPSERGQSGERDLTDGHSRAPIVSPKKNSERELIVMRSEDDLDRDMDTSPVQQTRELRGTCMGTIQSPDVRKVYKGNRRTWIRGEMLGLGTLGLVFKAMDAETGETFAVKEVLIDCKLAADVKFSQSLQREIDMLQDLKHDHIVSYLGHDTIEEKLYVYLEYMVGGSIAHIVSNFGALDEATIAAYTRDVLLGLQFLHSQDPPFLHRDIKGANILVGMDSKAKLSDFGCSKRVTDSMAHTMTGSIPWMAPEVMTDRGYGRKADIWSLGCLLIEMSSAHHPWESFDNNVVAMVRIAMSADIPKIPDHLSDICRNFILACLTRDPDERPNARSLLKHDFVTLEK